MYDGDSPWTSTPALLSSVLFSCGRNECFESGVGERRM